MQSTSLNPTEMLTLVRGLAAAWNDHDMERVAGFYASDYEGVDVGQAQPQRGPAGVCHALTCYLNAFPDLHFAGIDTVIQGNRAVLTWTARATHLGRLMNIPPTGRKVEVSGVSVLTIAGAQIKHALYMWDLAGLLRTLGLLPEL